MTTASRTTNRRTKRAAKAATPAVTEEAAVETAPVVTEEAPSTEATDAAEVVPAEIVGGHVVVAEAEEGETEATPVEAEEAPEATEEATETPAPVIQQAPEVVLKEEAVKPAKSALPVRVATNLEFIHNFIKQTSSDKEMTREEYSKPQRQMYLAILRIWKLEANEIISALKEIDNLWRAHGNSELSDRRIWAFGGSIKLPNEKSKLIIRYSLALFEAMAAHSVAKDALKRYDLKLLTDLLDPKAAEALNEFFGK